MNEVDAELQPPGECVVWCRAQDFALVVGDDIAPVDLDWWNTRLTDHKIPVRLWGRDPDGHPVDSGPGRRSCAATTCPPARYPMRGRASWVCSTGPQRGWPGTRAGRG
ncbi:MAG TPA: hypothetical protein VF299_01240 [Mycobacterium sp.]